MDSVGNVRRSESIAPPPVLQPLGTADGVRIAFPDFSDGPSRDVLLTYAYQLYDSLRQPQEGSPHPQRTSRVYRHQLLPLLNDLRSRDPEDIAVLLLLACTHHALGEVQSSVKVSFEILASHPHCAEAMYNIGTSMNALGMETQALEWWTKALQARPTYWDAVVSKALLRSPFPSPDGPKDNILAVLLQSSHSLPQEAAISQALDICKYVQQHVLDARGELIHPIPSTDLHRLQRMLCTAGCIKAAVMEPTHLLDLEILRAIEIVFHSPSSNKKPEPVRLRDIILSTYLAAYILYSESGGSVPQNFLSSFRSGSSSGRYLDIWQVVRESGDALLLSLIQEGGGTLPTLLLLPHQVARLLPLLFPASSGVLPAICTQDPNSGLLQIPPETIRQQTNLTTSTALLSLAKQHQERTHNLTIPGLECLTNAHQPLAVVLYYLALGLDHSPSVCNNMGIIFSATTWTRDYFDVDAGRHTLTGPTLAKLYYDSGLQIDPDHPHLLTNLGSLLKDQGHVAESIRYYQKAVFNKPDFDIALANLANAVKDEGRPWEAIEFYLRALDSNPHLPEALCGLVASLSSICDWRDMGHLEPEASLGETEDLCQSNSSGYLRRMVQICTEQLQAAYSENVEITVSVPFWLLVVSGTHGRSLRRDEELRWIEFLQALNSSLLEGGHEHVNKGGVLLRLLDWVQPRLQRRWYVRAYGKTHSIDDQPTQDNTPEYAASHMALAKTMTPPSIPAMLPFNTFSHALTSRMVRLISHRHATRISYAAASRPRSSHHIYPPPSPPVGGILRIGYVSNDINNHPLAHLMQSVFGFHDRKHFRIFLYATSPWDGTPFRPKISQEVDHFIDASSWSLQAILNDITKHQIHILINLGGYTKGARNDIFAARPCPLQIQLMGYAGTLAAGWCDYLVCDPIACPPELCASERWRSLLRSSEAQESSGLSFDLAADLDPESPSEDWIYSEKLMYMPHSFMVTDHKQSFPEDTVQTHEQGETTLVEALWYQEEVKRAEMRSSIFPQLPHDFIIFANFNQLYKIDPGIFLVWLKILTKVPRSVLWLLRFPPAGEEHLRRTAKMWAGEEVSSRVQFTNVATKEIHINRCRVADLFLDTTECNAHTTAADVLWAGTPILTWPKHKHKMCSRVAASMAYATGFGDQMVVNSAQDYEERAVRWATDFRYQASQGPDGKAYSRGEGSLMKLRRNILLNRDKMPLFDTKRWTRNLEKGFREAWRRWVEGTQYEMSDEWEECQGPEKESGCIWITDDSPVEVKPVE